MYAEAECRAVHARFMGSPRDRPVRKDALIPHRARGIRFLVMEALSDRIIRGLFLHPEGQEGYQARGGQEQEQSSGEICNSCSGWYHPGIIDGTKGQAISRTHGRLASRDRLWRTMTGSLGA